MNKESVVIRPEVPEDYDEVYQVNKSAFEGEGEAKLVDKLRKTKNYIPEVSLVALVEKKIVGHILFSTVKVKTEKEAVSVLSLAPMAVLPALQRQGIGSQLVEQGLSECKRLGFKAVVVVGHPDYYPRFGFSSAKEKGLKLPFDVPDKAFMAYELVSGALDEISGMIEYPPEFNDLA